MLPRRPIRWLAWCCLAWLLVSWFALDVLGDRVWWTVPILFGPRWLLAAPWLGLLPWLVIDVRRAVVPALAGFAIAVFALMGWEPGLHRASVAGRIPFRVLELNAGGSNEERRAAAVLAELRDRQPDLIVIAECGPRLAQALTGMAGYQLRTGDELCMLSRGEVLEWEPRDQHDAWMRYGSGAIVRAVVATTTGRIRVGLVHLATPRNALDAYFSLSKLFRQDSATRVNIALRDDESATARAWIVRGPDLPTIVVGDFNLTVESAIYRRHWGGYRNAFSRAGRGTGYTKHTRLWGVRIDHVLTSADIGTQYSFIGRNVGSDHQPLIADLVLPGP